MAGDISTQGGTGAAPAASPTGGGDSGGGSSGQSSGSATDFVQSMAGSGASDQDQGKGSEGGSDTGSGPVSRDHDADPLAGTKGDDSTADDAGKAGDDAGKGGKSSSYSKEQLAEIRSFLKEESDKAVAKARKEWEAQNGGKAPKQAEPAKGDDDADYIALVKDAGLNPTSEAGKAMIKLAKGMEARARRHAQDQVSPIQERMAQERVNALTKSFATEYEAEHGEGSFREAAPVMQEYFDSVSNPNDPAFERNKLQLLSDAVLGRKYREGKLKERDSKKTEEERRLAIQRDADTRSGESRTQAPAQGGKKDQSFAQMFVAGSAGKKAG